jgi:two-component system, NarL family, invasion response regulator UvrY
MINILLVDDHPIIRDGLRAALAQDTGLNVVGEAQNADEAIAKTREARPDVVLLDISLPDKNGFEVLKLIHTEMPEIRVLILSTYSEKQYAVRCLKSGAWGYLTKSSGSAELIEAIRTIMQGRKYVGASLAQLLVSDNDPNRVRMPHEVLSDREFQILCLFGQGNTVSRIADILSLSVSTVGTHRAHILEKMNMRTTAELVKYTLEHHLVE